MTDVQHTRLKTDAMMARAEASDQQLLKEQGGCPC